MVLFGERISHPILCYGCAHELLGLRVEASREDVDEGGPRP